MYTTYELRLYDETMMQFALKDSGDLTGLQAQILWTNESNAHLLPLDLQRDDKGLLRWLRRRVIPKNRAFVHEILQSLGLQMGDTKGISDCCEDLYGFVLDLSQPVSFPTLSSFLHFPSSPTRL